MQCVCDKPAQRQPGEPLGRKITDAGLAGPLPGVRLYARRECVTTLIPDLHDNRELEIIAQGLNQAGHGANRPSPLKARRQGLARERMTGCIVPHLTKLLEFVLNLTASPLLNFKIVEIINIYPIKITEGPTMPLIKNLFGPRRAI